MVLRPYQYYATEAIIKQVRTSRKNGYIWHTTGSGKTLTSFKASQIVMDLPEVHKVVFVVDRKDLDYQTMKEFNSFKKDSVDVTDNTRSLVRQFRDDTKLIVTTIQKLNNAISKRRYESGMEHLKDKRMVFIFDECHRSQFGETHKRIAAFFQNIQLFGFTGTPIFAENAHKNEMGKRTTKDLFSDCLHKYVITDAIRDQNVLKFNIEYIGRYKQKSNTFIDIEVEDIDTREVIDSPERLEKIVDYIIRYHNQKTHNRGYTAIFAVSSIDNLIKYYELFKNKKEEGEHDLRIATIFTYGVNEDDSDATGMLPDYYAMAAEPLFVYNTSHSREKLDEFIADYNAMYNTGFSTKDSRQYENYFKDISKRIKEREKVSFNEKDRVDILLVVNMFLTGFDAKKVNTLYADKNLRYHGLMQAFSRTNRILNEQKSHGNILCFRNLRGATDEAIALFSKKEAKEEILLPPYEVIVRKFSEAFANLLKIRRR
jgi:type I restriction enzyme R subunit